MILLSFDIEEFDMPFEYQKNISFDDQIGISIAGTTIILDILQKNNVKATFFSTVVFAENAPKIIDRIIAEGHELASHSYFHSQFEVAHLKSSKLRLEALSKSKINGFRMPRMQPVDENDIFDAGYQYNSSLNPTYLPGRYNHFSKPRRFFYDQKVLQIPASVSPIIRFPLFWLSFHNLPLFLYKWLCIKTLNTDKYLNLYFHPWEFIDLSDQARFGFPAYVSKNSGQKMAVRMDNFIQYMKNKKYEFATFQTFIETMVLKK